ncbi:hypothetical protein [Novosphingobium sp. FKTRR1]|uniref:hypothetical protein n=1 Tax=Novosphingobium sp. FKTRR1 TaxID=2879118 RepID=UPI001CF05900|nr:hypothetical protein [Novosphingobium sp. FKTRR1]
MHTADVSILANALDGTLPDAVLAVPSMMSLKERLLLQALAQHEYRGDGVIVDAGVFCGGSTLCLGTGIEGNPARDAILARWPQPIRTYEYGIVNPGMIPFFERHNVAGDWQVGESFEAYLRGNIAPVADKVELTMGDISLATWDGAPIEIMFLDVVKSHAIQMAVLRTFMPHLLVGGILLQQDYFIDGLPFLKIMQEHFADHFEYLGEVWSLGMFRLIKPFAPEAFATDPIPAMTLEYKLELLDRTRDRSIDPFRRLLCDLGKVRFLASIGENAQAVALLDTLPEAYPAQFGDDQLPRIRNAVRAATNRAHGKATTPPRLVRPAFPVEAAAPVLAEPVAAPVIGEPLNTSAVLEKPEPARPGFFARYFPFLPRSSTAQVP